MKKRLGSVLLALALVLSLAPTLGSSTARADEKVALRVEIRGLGAVQIGDNAPVSETTTVYYMPGTTVTLKATPAEGYRLAFWFNGSEWTGTPGSRELTVTVSGDKKCIAEFVSTSEAYSAAWVTGEGSDMTSAGGKYTVDCGPANVGYGEQDWKYVRVLNTSGGYINICDEAPFTFTAVSSGNAENWFECSANSDTMIYHGSWAGLQVRPKTGLPAGTYTATMTLQEVCDPGIDPPLTAEITFTVTNNHVVTVSASPAKGGTVTGSGIYANGAKATLTATPNEHYKFARWSDGNTKNPRTLTVNESMTLSAEFERTDASIVVNIRGDGSVQVGDNAPTSVSGATYYFEPGTEVTLRATPASGYRLAFWFNGSEWTGTPGSRELTVTVSGDKECIAEFVSTSEAYSAAWVTGEGSDMTSAGGKYTMDCGAASAGYDVQNWKYVRVRNTSESGYIKVYDTKPFTFKAVGSGNAEDWFECDAHTDTMVFHGSWTSLRVRPKTGLSAGTYTATMTLQEVCDPGIATPLTATITFTVTNDCVISAVIDGGKGGTVTGAGTYKFGNTVTLTATADTNYAFDHWERENGTTSTSNPLTFRAAGAEAVTAYFRRVSYTVSASADPAAHGTVTLKDKDGKTVSGGSYADGTKLTAVASAKKGYVFSNWTDNGNPIASDVGKPGTVTVTANPDHVLVAHFVSYSLSGGKVCAPKGALLALAKYDSDGKMLSVKLVKLTGECVNADAATLLGISTYPEHYKLFLIDSSTFVPLCAAWEN